jgi:NitT/TauT family transport system ATP-binding protein
MYELLMITVRNLAFGYSAAPVIKDISFSIGEGETVGVVGISGSGKSTLLRLIAGLLPSRTGSEFYRGEVLYDGMATPTSYQDGRIGMMFQDPTLLPNRTVFENVRLPLDILGLSDDDTVRDLVAQVGLGQSISLRPHALSGGMKTRTALARTFVTKPRFMFLDEPFASLDVGWRLALYRIFLNLVRSHTCTALIVSHDIQEMLLLCDRVFVLSHEGMLLECVHLSERQQIDLDVDYVRTHLRDNWETYLHIQSLIYCDAENA